MHNKQEDCEKDGPFSTSDLSQQVYLLNWLPFIILPSSFYQALLAMGLLSVVEVNEFSTL